MAEAVLQYAITAKRKTSNDTSCGIKRGLRHMVVVWDEVIKEIVN